jgi:hypothetical protein
MDSTAQFFNEVEWRYITQYAKYAAHNTIEFQQLFKRFTRTILEYLILKKYIR